MPPKKPPHNPDDMSLWHHYVQGMKPMAHNRVDHQPDRVKPVAKQRPIVHAPITSHGSLAYNKPKKHTKPISIDRTLDLHGMTRDLAFQALERFILRAWHGGDLTLRVVTGKGMFAPVDNHDDPYSYEGTRGVLRQLFPQWLEQTHLRAYVSYYAPAKESDGGSGAFYVVLKKRIKGY